LHHFVEECLKLMAGSVDVPDIRNRMNFVLGAPEHHFPYMTLGHVWRKAAVILCHFPNQRRWRAERKVTAKVDTR
jgi:hypothetical protein